MENSAHQGQSGLSFTNKEGYVAAGAFLAAGVPPRRPLLSPFRPFPQPQSEKQGAAHTGLQFCRGPCVVPGPACPPEFQRGRRLLR